MPLVYVQALTLHMKNVTSQKMWKWNIEGFSTMGYPYFGWQELDFSMLSW